MTLTALLSLVALLVVSELFSNLAVFAESKADVFTLMKFLAYSVPRMVHLVLPFSVCLGVLAAQAALARNSETIAMQACSVPLSRIYIPYLMVGLLATAVMSSTSFYLYPVAQKEADKIEQLSIRKSDVAGSFTVMGGRFKAGQDIWSVANLDVTKGTMANITCYRFADGRLKEVIHADKSRWDGKQWSAQGMTIVDLGEKGISDPRPATVLPLAKEPEALVMAQTNTEVLSIEDLRSYVLQLRASHASSPTIETFYQSKISFAISPFIITLLVIPFGMNFPRAGGIAKGVTIGLMLGLSYWFLHSGMAQLGSLGFVKPLVASWGANIMALIVALLVLFRKRRAVYG